MSGIVSQQGCSWEEGRFVSHLNNSVRGVGDAEKPPTEKMSAG